MPSDSKTRRTIQGYLDMMRHRLGKVPASRHVLIDTLNEAGRALFIAAEGEPHYHTWSWATAENVQLLIPAGVDRVPLPDDFGSLVAIEEEDRVVGSVQQTTAGHLLELRADTTTSNLTLWVAFDVGESQLNPEVGPRKVAAIYPVQGDERTDIRMTYNRTWIDVHSDDTGRIPNIPPEWDRLLRLMAQAFAVEIEDGTNPFDNDPYAAELSRLVSFDAGRQVLKGRPTHSVRDRARGGGGFQYPHEGITRV